MSDDERRRREDAAADAALEGRWRLRTARADRPRILHVTPIGDLRRHSQAAKGARCWCKPDVRRHVVNGLVGYVIVHHSADGRELVEEHGLQ